MRRTVATLLVVASPILLAGPVGARETSITSAGPPVVVPAIPTAVVPSTPPPVPEMLPPTPVRHAVAKPAAVTRAEVDGTVYDARLGADLCQARAVFCGLDRGGRYPAG